MDTPYDRKSIRKQLKQNAKAVLHRDLWGNVGLQAPVIFVLYLEFLVSFLMDENNTATTPLILNLILSIVGTIVVIYAQYIQSYQSIKQLRDETVTARPMQSWFKTYLTKSWQKTLWLSVWMIAIYLIGWAILAFLGELMIQASALIMIIAQLSYTIVPSFVYWLLAIGIILLVVFTFIYIIKWYKYILVPFVGYNDQSLKGFQLIAKSRELMVGHRWELFVMQLSFFWWGLLTLITLGLAGFYTIPYMVLTLAGYFDVLNDAQNKQSHLDDSNEQKKIQPIILQPSNQI